MYEKGVEAFLSVAVSKTLGRAAELLNVTQSTVSHNLRELEKELGLVLVDRQKGVKVARLTPAGEDFLPVAVRWQEASNEISNAGDSGFACSISLGIPQNLGAGFILPFCGALLAHKPAVQVKISEERPDRIYQAVEDRRCDLAITAREEVSRSVLIEPLYHEKFVVVRVAEKGEGPAKEASLPALSPENEFFIDWGLAYRLWRGRFWNPSRSRLRLDSAAAAAALMSSPGQWCVVPRSASRHLRFAADNNIIIENILDAPPDIMYYKITSRRPRAGVAMALEIFDRVVSECGFGRV